VLKDFASKNEVKDLVSKRKILRRCPNRHGATRTYVYANSIGES